MKSPILCLFIFFISLTNVSFSSDIENEEVKNELHKIQIFVKMQQFNIAENNLKCLLCRYPDNSSIWYWQGRCILEKIRKQLVPQNRHLEEEYHNAQISFEKAILFAPDNPLYYHWKTVCLLRQEKYEQAFKVINLRITKFPSDGVVYVDRVAVNMIKSRELTPDMLNDVKYANSLSPNNCFVMYWTAVLLKNSQLYEEAEDLCIKCKNLLRNENDLWKVWEEYGINIEAHIHFLLSEISLEQYNYCKSLYLINKAISLESKDASFYLLRATIKHRMNYETTSIYNDLKMCISLYPEIIQNHEIPESLMPYLVLSKSVIKQNERFVNEPYFDSGSDPPDQRNRTDQQDDQCQ